MCGIGLEVVKVNSIDAGSSGKGVSEVNVTVIPSAAPGASLRRAGEASGFEALILSIIRVVESNVAAETASSNGIAEPRRGGVGNGNHATEACRSVIGIVIQLIESVGGIRSYIYIPDIVSMIFLILAVGDWEFGDLDFLSMITGCLWA